MNRTRRGVCGALARVLGYGEGSAGLVERGGEDNREDRRLAIYPVEGKAGKRKSEEKN